MPRATSARAEQVRHEMHTIIGADVGAIKPGSPEAEALKKTLMARGAWSPYLEVGIGPYAEIFTKAPAMSAVGYGAEIGIRPEFGLEQPRARGDADRRRQGHASSAPPSATTSTCATSRAAARCCSAIAKDNNGSCALGPFVRLFDDDLHLGRRPQAPRSSWR